MLLENMVLILAVFLGVGDELEGDQTEYAYCMRTYMHAHAPMITYAHHLHYNL